MTRSVLVVGIGGATSSGKTTLAKNLAGVLASASVRVDAVRVLHQDDFTYPPDQMPWNEKWQVTDWDTPHGAINYERMATVLGHLRAHGEFPHDYKSNEHLRSEYDCKLSEAQQKEWAERLNGLDHVAVGATAVPSVTIVIVEGYLLYFSAKVRRLIDIPLFLRVSRAEMDARRKSRSNYVLEDGTVWEDPPFYFDEIVWPAYVEAHAGLFAGRDVEKGVLAEATEQDSTRDGAPVRDLVLFDGHSVPHAKNMVAVGHVDRNGVKLALAVLELLLERMTPKKDQ
ncbi:hypothetical protein MCUN1_002358 [Malassezia cuniculi]|uniref:Nicotinamide riboside kinase n=1 Tax=Malassezia cuniculi TaxID=948313 RepID=A0AAF0J6F3_9BASI|nr:hypothetical protein MCUN1_002358 [Malassezia cuniculi]